MEQKFAFQIRYDSDFDKMVKLTAKMGFRAIAIDFSGSDLFLTDNWAEEINRLSDILKESGISCVQLCAPAYTGDTEPQLRCIRSAALLSAEIVALEPMTAEPFENSLQANLDILRPLIREAENNCCLLGLRNPAPSPDEKTPFFTQDPQELLSLIDGLKSPHVCIVWDFGHANLAYRDAISPMKAVKHFIKGTYIHNNNRVLDDHILPFWNTSAWGPAINWHTMMSAFRETDYDGYLTLDVRYNCKMGISTFLKNALESLNALDGLLHASEKESNQ